MKLNKRNEVKIDFDTKSNYSVGYNANGLLTVLIKCS